MNASATPTLRLAGINTDIDLRKQLELRLAHQAGHDALTGLPNRNLFHDRIERAIRQVIPADQLDTVIDNIGLPLSGVNMVYNASGTIGPQDGDIQVVLKEDHAPTADFVRANVQ